MFRQLILSSCLFFCTSAFAQSFEKTLFAWTPLNAGASQVADIDLQHLRKQDGLIYVAIRLAHEVKGKPAHNVSVYAFDCAKKTAAMAQIGLIADDGQSEEWGQMNSVRVLKKYNEALPTRFVYVQPAFDAVCN